MVKFLIPHLPSAYSADSPETLSGFVENNVLSRLNSTSRCTLCAFESFQLQFIPASPELALCVEGFAFGCGSRRAVLEGFAFYFSDSIRVNSSSFALIRG